MPSSSLLAYTAYLVSSGIIQYDLNTANIITNNMMEPTHAAHKDESTHAAAHKDKCTNIPQRAVKVASRISIEKRQPTRPTLMTTSLWTFVVRHTTQ